MLFGLQPCIQPGCMVPVRMQKGDELLIWQASREIQATFSRARLIMLAVGSNKRRLKTSVLGVPGWANIGADNPAGVSSSAVKSLRCHRISQSGHTL